jgi:hypothetical protein
MKWVIEKKIQFYNTWILYLIFINKFKNCSKNFSKKEFDKILFLGILTLNVLQLLTAPYSSFADAEMVKFPLFTHI